MNTNQSIITQVAAKIASELVPKTDNLENNILMWNDAFDAVTEALFAKVGDDVLTAPQTVTSTTTYTAPSSQEAMLQNAFPTGSVSSMNIRVRGEQHGPLPEWLATACAKDGVGEVWDNRDKLSINPKRPWFKSTTSDKAYWAPR